MGRHVAGEMPALDRLVDDACAEIGREIDSLCIPRLAGVVLGGGYGRGEGGAKEKLEGIVGETPTFTLSNDLDFFAITEEGVPEVETVAAIGEALKPLSEKWTAKLGVDVDFTVKTPWRIRHDQERLMIQELVRGYCDVAGAKGEGLFADIRRIEAAAVPWMEAARLLMNRGMGLLLAKCKVDGASAVESRMSAEDIAFVNRNINKCVLGAGDARLVARHDYRWRATERADALGDALYRAAVEWKFRPRAEAVCDWETARTAWLEAEAEVMKVGSASGELGRSFYQAARWVARRKTLGELASTGQNCVVRVLKRISHAVRSRSTISAELKIDWEVFN